MKINVNKSVMLVIVFFAFIWNGCQTVFDAPPLDTSGERLSTFMPQTDLSEHPLYAKLKESADDPEKQERVKIEYLLMMTESSDFEFDRNGVRYDGKKTAQHLRKKYRKAFRNVTTARDFIDGIATRSSMSGRNYMAFPGNGYAYNCHELLNYELSRLEQAIS